VIVELSRHYKLAISILKDVEIYARYYGFTVRRSDYPFQVILDFELQRGMVWSVHCSGFTKRIDLQKLTKRGHPDFRFTERGFMSAKALVNFLNRRKSKDIRRAENEY